MSALEDALLKQIREAGLPEPVREYRFSPPRMWRWDICWPDKWLAIEVDGGTERRARKIGGRYYVLISGHNSIKGIEASFEKANEATLKGWRILRFNGTMIEDRRALTAIKRALNREETDGRDDGSDAARFGWALHEHDAQGRAGGR